MERKDTIYNILQIGALATKGRAADGHMCEMEAFVE